MEIKTLDDVLIALHHRTEARQRRDWATADYIFNVLKANGVHLHDTKKYTFWRLA